jgi:hypothetical protein
MEYKNNVFTLNTKSIAPDTITISFNNSETYTYNLSSDNINLTSLYNTMNSNPPSEVITTTSYLEFHDDNN